MMLALSSANYVRPARRRIVIRLIAELAAEFTRALIGGAFR